jgi:hypothetical protein
MAQPRSTMVRSLGLVTQPNNYGHYPDGALKRCENAVARNPGELYNAPGFYGANNVNLGDAILHSLTPLNAGHVYELSAFGTTWTLTENGNAVAIPSTFSTTNLFSATGRISPARARERVLFNSAEGYLVGDNMAPATGPERALRAAGLAQPLIRSITAASTGVIPAGVLVGYAVVLRRKFADGYELVSVPSPIVRYYNAGSSGSVGITVRVACSQPGTVAGDILELYRTNGLATNNGTAADPGNTLKLVKAVVISAADITAHFLNVADTQPTAAPYYVTTGEELYTNPLQESTLQANRQPPIAKCTATFKGYTFYGNTTDRPRWEWTVPAGLGSSYAFPGLATPFWRLNGVGERGGGGTIAIGSPAITGVSAADMVGIKVGQAWTGQSSYFAFSTVIAVGASTITMSSNALANASGAATWALVDVIVLNGIVAHAASLTDFLSWVVALNGDWEITSDQSFSDSLGGAQSATVSIEPGSPSSTASFTVCATNGANYSPVVPEYTATPQTFSQTTSKNHIQWSKSQQPEHAPAANEDFVGMSELIAMQATRDAIVLWCTDGPWRLSGDGGVWRIDNIDLTTILCGPQASTVLDENVIGYTNAGVIKIADSSVEDLSTLVIGDQLPGPAYAEVVDIIMERNEQEDEIYLSKGKADNQLYVLNMRTRTWTTLTGNARTSAITALAWQRTPGSAIPARPLIGISPQGGFAPSYAGWGSPAVNHLAMLLQFQPFYADDPLGLKQWISCTYIFDTGSAGTVITPGWFGTLQGSATIVTHETSAYATVGPPQRWGVAHAIAPMFQETVSQFAPIHFQGLSLMYAPCGGQAKQK